MPPPYSSATIVEEDEGPYTPEEEKGAPMLDDDDDHNYSPTDGSYHPSALSRSLNRLSLDFGEGFDMGSNSPDSPQSFQEILDIGSGGITHSGSSSSLPLKDDVNTNGQRPTYI